MPDENLPGFAVNTLSQVLEIIDSCSM